MNEDAAVRTRFALRELVDAFYGCKQAEDSILHPALFCGMSMQQNRLRHALMRAQDVLKASEQR